MPQRPGFKRGDVVLVLFPHTDLRTAKTRPALIIQADDLGTNILQVIVAMISSRMIRAGHACRVVVQRDSADGRRSGLLNDSVVMTDNLATVTEAVVYRVIGSLTMTDIDKALRHTLAL